MAIAIVQAPAPAPKAKVSAYKQNDETAALVAALTSLPADGQTAIVVDGKTAKGLTLVAGKILTKLGFVGRFEEVNATTVRIWKIRDDAALAAKAKAREARKVAKAEAEAKNLAELKG